MGIMWPKLKAKFWTLFFKKDVQQELAQNEAEAIGWIPLDDGAYLHVGSDETVIQVVGIAKEEMAGRTVFLDNCYSFNKLISCLGGCIESIHNYGQRWRSN